MAITLQMARVSQDIYELFTKDNNLLNKLLSYDLLEKSCYEDLNWFPDFFNELHPYLGLPDCDINLINKAIRGDNVLANQGDISEDIYSDIYVCERKSVFLLADTLKNIPFCELIYTNIYDNWKSIFSDNEWSENPSSYLCELYLKLLRFYALAKNNNEFIIIWFN